MNNFTSQPTKQKDDFFMSTYFKLIMIALLTVTVLTACGDGSDKLPKIISVTYLEEENSITVDATDDVKVTGYLLTKLDGEPKLDDSTWKQSNVFNYIKGSGTFNVWVKDADNNLSRSEIVIEDPIVVLAKDYEFLQWYLDDTTTKTVDGVSYDLVALKQQYGDLYRFVEPLSKEEVEYRFKYLTEYFAKQAEKGIYEQAPGGLFKVSEKITPTAYPRIKNNFKTLYEGNVSDLEKFSKYYFYVEKTDRHYPDMPESLRFNGEFYPNLLINVYKTALFEDKDWFVRDYLSQMDIYLNSYKINNVDPEFELLIPNKTK